MFKELNVESYVDKRAEKLADSAKNLIWKDKVEPRVQRRDYDDIPGASLR